MATFHTLWSFNHGHVLYTGTLNRGHVSYNTLRSFNHGHVLYTVTLNRGHVPYNTLWSFNHGHVLYTVTLNRGHVPYTVVFNRSHVSHTVTLNKVIIQPWSCFIHCDHSAMAMLHTHWYSIKATVHILFLPEMSLCDWQDVKIQLLTKQCHRPTL